MDRFARRLGIVAGIFCFTLLAGTAGFIVVEHYSPFDAFYMTLITLTTVGYGELKELSRAGRIFNSFLMLLGVVTMLLVGGAVTQTIVELELGEFYGKRRIKRMIDKLENHYIVCGFGRVGRSACAELQRAGAPFLVVDSNPDKVERAIRSGYMAVAADSTHDATLREVGVARAKGLVAALSSDADNLFLILSAKTLNADLHLAARVAEEEAEQKLRRAGADTVFAPYAIAGHRLAQALLQPHVARFLDFTTGAGMGLNVSIEQVMVDEKSPFAGKSLRDMQIRRDLGVIVLAIRKADGQMAFNPPAEAEVAAGDHLIVMGGSDDLTALERLLSRGI
ncbi:MAG: potassium channel protein [Bryobacterales bacterium]|nr:potassium channel protein [Bryobacterales bacterium]